MTTAKRRTQAMRIWYPGANPRMGKAPGLPGRQNPQRVPSWWTTNRSERSI